MDILINSTLSPEQSRLCERSEAIPSSRFWPLDCFTAFAKTVTCSKAPVLSHEEKAGNYYQNILTCLGYSSDNPPVADLLRRYHGLKNETDSSRWLIASPIHWQATHNDAMIMACDAILDLSDAESRLWFAALAEFLAHDNVKLHYHDAYTWLIHFETSPPINARPPQKLLQQSMMQQLQALDSTLFWPRFITENQMFFSEHLLNKAREGRYPVNGLWIWGGGDLKAPGSRPFICDDERDCHLADLVTTDVRRYTPGFKYPKDAVLLFSDFEGQQASPFEKNTVHWYWNNAEYVTKPKSWFARLLRK